MYDLRKGCVLLNTWDSNSFMLVDILDSLEIDTKNYLCSYINY